ncbi:Broad-complex core protein isoforms 1/2/3/4/5 [Amphibalanus amphitrite]|uniref:Broad-complex core protein isoforms 1/2/3/4/5 n=1 Tax=Amphibalanus amphitrite TaxID=1232801 RepID=A0A6A4VP94_AMPAM|nr:Broad-complex core protein isoforms 1/2/3/4/5 [Amphibalanus amphitrite]
MGSGGQQMFNLRWNNFQSSISSALHEQLLGEELVDVTLSAEGRTVGAHRVVLSACSPYFKQLFKTLPCQQHPVIVMRDCKFADIQTLLAFIYQGEVQVSNSALPSLLRTAEVLSIKGLTPSHLREEQPTPAESLVGWGEAFTPQPQSQPTPRARPQPSDESPSKRAKTGGSAESRRDPPPAAASPSELSATTPLNLSCAPSAPPPPSQPAQPPAGRFTLKIPTVPGAALAADDNGADGSPRVESDDGSWLDWDSKESRSSKPASPPSVPATVSPPDTGSAESGPVWKNLLPKPNRRMLPVKCPECSKLISNAYNLRVHMDLHKHLTYICSLCSTPTRSRDTLRKHITNIHKVKGEALREMLDHGIVSSEAPAEPVKPAPAASAAAEDSKDDKEPALVVDESSGQPSPAAAEPPAPGPGRRRRRRRRHHLLRRAPRTHPVPPRPQRASTLVTKHS